MKMKRLNFDQCGKNSARGYKLNDHEIDSWIELWTLWQIFHQSIQFVVNLWQNQNSEAQRNYDCDSCGKSST